MNTNSLLRTRYALGAGILVAVIGLSLINLSVARTAFYPVIWNPQVALLREMLIVANCALSWYLVLSATAATPLPSKRRFRLVVGSAVAITVSTAATIWSMFYDVSSAHFLKNSIAAVATVTSITPEDHYLFRYRYRVGDDTYSGSAFISSLATNPRVGEKVGVLYDGRFPGSSELATSLRGRIGENQFMLTMVGVVLPFGIFLRALYRSRAQGAE